MEISAKDFDSHVMACKTFLDKNEIIPTNYDQQKGTGLVKYESPTI